MSVTRRHDQGAAAAAPRVPQTLPSPAELAASRLRMLELLVDNAPDAIHATDPEGRYLPYNREAVRLAGVGAGDVIGRDDREFFSPAQAEVLRADDAKVMAQAAPRRFEQAHDTPDGPMVFTGVSGPLHGERGQVVGSFGISRCISDRLAIDAQLRAGGRRYRDLFQASPHPMWVYGIVRLRFLAVNDAAVRDYGFTREEFLGMTIIVIRTLPEQARLLTDIGRAGAARGLAGPEQWVHQRRDGRAIDVAIRSNDLLFEGRPARLVTAHDITQRLRAAQDLRFSELRYRLAAAHGQVWDWDIGSGHGDLPAAFWGLFLGCEAPKEGALAAQVVALMHPVDLAGLRLALTEHRARRQPCEYRFRLRDADGQWRWFHFTGQAVWDAAGRATYMAGTVSDISERRCAKRALAEAYNRGVFDQFADGVLLIADDDRLLDANAQACTMLGYRRDELLLLQLSALLPAADRGRLARARVSSLKTNPQLRKWIHQRKDGSRFPAEVSLRRLDDRRTIAVLRDITARHAAEQAVLACQEELTALTRRLLTQETVTAQRLAQGLHDQLGQTLTAARLHLQAALMAQRTALPSTLDGPCRQAIGRLKQASRELRQVPIDLPPPVLEDHGLVPALRAEIAQAIGNARQHVGASPNVVTLQGAEDRLMLQVRDDGRGIVERHLRGRTGHLGILGMRERAAAIRAPFVIERLPSPERGTRAALHWPAPPT